MDNLKIDGHKMMYHPKRVGKWLDGETTPIYVEISPVGHCNHRCIFCALDYLGYQNRSLDLKVTLEALASMASIGVKSVMFAGEGEPLLHPNLHSMVYEAKQCGLDVALTTNGTLMSLEFLRECMQDISWIKISINAGEAGTYSGIHKTKITDWDKVWNNINAAVIHRDINQLKTAIGIQMVVLPENYLEVEQLAYDAKLAGVDYLVLKPHSQHKMSNNKDWEGMEYWFKDELAKAMEQYNKDPEFQVIVRRDSMELHEEKDRGYKRCHAVPHLWAYVMATGDVYGCSAHLLKKDFCYGNINEKSFGEIWNGPRRWEAIQFMRDFCLDDCRKICRMDKINRYLEDIKRGTPHQNFI